MKTKEQMNEIRNLHAQGGLEDVTLAECESEYTSQFPEIEDSYSFDPTDTVENRLFGMAQEVAQGNVQIGSGHNCMTFVFAEKANAETFQRLASEDEDVESVSRETNAVSVEFWN